MMPYPSSQVSCVATVASPPTASSSTAAPSHAKRPRIVAFSSSTYSVPTGDVMPICLPSALSLLNLRDEELLQRFAREPEFRRFFQRLVRVPAIDDRAFHEPHPGGSSTARS